MRAALLLLFLVPLSTVADTSSTAECPQPLRHTLQKLNSSDTVDLCQFAGQPLLVVNTASHCGFTRQFEGLQTLYATYHERGLDVLGVPSNDFRQEARDEEKTASVCYLDYGVTFTMTSPQRVRGRAAHPLFRYLAEESGSAPRWNFYKYLLDADGNVVDVFSSRVELDDARLIEAIERVLPAEQVAQ